jgi:tetratricopeptide (TPR) repeat protein
MRTLLGIFVGIVCMAMGDYAQQHEPKDANTPEVIKLAFHVAGELKLGGLYILVLAAVSGLVLREGVKEGLAPSIREGLSELDKPIREGLEQAMQRFPPLLEGWLRPREKDADARLAENEKLPPDLVVLAKEGNPQEAIDQLSIRGQPTEEQVISMLIMSPKAEDHIQAESRLNASPSPKARLYLRLGYKFWLGGDLNRAIEMSEKSLKLAPPSGEDGENTKLVARIKNSLAYFYAELPDERKADLAHRYIRDAIEDIPNAAEFLDTLGAVKIAFGKTKGEIDEGIKLCFRAAAADQDYIHFHKWLSRAIERTKTLTATLPGSDTPPDSGTTPKPS